LFGKNVGIIGLGYIGKQLAQRCSAHGSTVGYFGRAPWRESAYIYFADIRRLAEFADVLFGTCRGGADMDGLADRNVLSKLSVCPTTWRVMRIG
jgi:lactate dehydrogenase-like 2-hydroxyacid dehydrogenase